MKPKSDFIVGLERILNNPTTNFIQNPKVFNEVIKHSGMDVPSMIRYIGKKSKVMKPPSDDQKIKERLGALAVSSE